MPELGKRLPEEKFYSIPNRSEGYTPPGMHLYGLTTPGGTVLWQQHMTEAGAASCSLARKKLGLLGAWLRIDGLERIEKL